MQKENPFDVRREDDIKEFREAGLVFVLCKVPLLCLAGPKGEILANKLVTRLNKTFNGMYSELIESVDEAERIRDERAKRKWSWHMYLAVFTVLKTQRDNGLGPITWQEIYDHPDFNFSPVLGSIFGAYPYKNRRSKMQRIRNSIRGAIRHLKLRGVDVGQELIAGKGIGYYLS